MDFSAVTIELQCRICLDIQGSQEEMTSLFEIMEGDFTLSDILTNISNIEVKANENVPSNVCNSCLATIINFHNLLLQFQHTEEFFKKTFFDTFSKENISEDNSNDFILQSPTDINSEPDEQCDDSAETVLEDSKGVHILSYSQTQSATECKYMPVAQSEVKVTNNSEEFCNTNELKYRPKNCDFLLQNNENGSKDEECIMEQKDPLFSESISNKLMEETENEIITESLKYSCTECGDSFLYKPGFNQHMLQRHNKHLKGNEYAQYSTKIIVKEPKMFPEFIRIPKIFKDIDNHQFQCRVCKNCFESDSELKEHLNIHKTHVCPVCGLAFLKKYYLTDHLVVHSAERNYVCQICNANFRHRNALTAHKNCHKNVRDHTCETCGKSFKDKGTLRVHIKLKHSEERNYSCSKCPLKFKLKSFLDKHFIRRHTVRTKDFICSECGVAYLNKTTLMRHISEKHLGKNPQHICPICCKSFSVRLTLNRHLQSIHKIEINK